MTPFRCSTDPRCPTKRLQRITHAHTWRIALIGCALVGLFLLPAGAAHAQLQNLPTQPEGMKDYGKPGVPRITVYLWGYADTGVWTVAEGTDLMEFLSVASRVPPNIRPNNRVIRTLTVFRNGYTKEKPYFKSRLNKMFATRSGYPDLQNGDILVLNTQERPRFTWRDIARVTGTVVGVLNTYLLLDRLNDDNN